MNEHQIVSRKTASEQPAANRKRALNGHEKLCGGGERTADHDRKRMTEAREMVKKANKAEDDRVSAA